MKLLIDAGNSMIKWRMTKQRLFMAGGAVSRDLLREKGLPWSELEPPESIVLSNVAGIDAELAIKKWADHWNVAVRIVTPQERACGIHSGYSRSETLGADRWLALIGARALLDTAYLVIDCGTAVTVDYVTAQGRHLGGLILPGRKLMSESLQRGTSRVSVRESSVVNGFGINTSECVEAGIAAAIAGAAEYAVTRFAPKEAFTCVLTGGDSLWLVSHLGMTCRHEPDLVFNGLALWAEQMS